MKTGALGSDRPPPARPDLDSTRVRRWPSEVDLYSCLLDLAADLDVDAGPAELSRRTLDTLSSLLPDHAVGLCVVHPSADSPWVDMRLPPGLSAPGRDPTRLFPELRDERIIAMEALPGSTLHVASPDGTITDGSTAHLAAERAAQILARALRSALTLTLAKPPSPEVVELQKQLVQAEKLATLGQIVAGVVHELANPLTSIVACTEFLLRKASAAAREEKEQIERIGLSANRILKFSRNLIAYARPASEVPAPVPLHEVIAQAHAFTQHELERRGITFAVDHAGGAPPILGQAGPLTQVFVNLFINAAHAMSDHGGQLAVRTWADDDQKRILVEVTDTGIGMTAASVERIFEPFFTTKERGKGTGLGLSIVREIVEVHGGRIDVASTPGKGTTFTVSLPLLNPRP